MSEMNYYEKSDRELEVQIMVSFFGVGEMNEEGVMCVDDYMGFSIGDDWMRCKDFTPCHPNSNQIEQFIFPKLSEEIKPQISTQQNGEFYFIAILQWAEGEQDGEKWADYCHLVAHKFPYPYEVNRCKAIACLTAKDRMEGR